MALPHLKEDGKKNSNFKNSFEANFVCKSRMQQKNLDSQEMYVKKQRCYDNFNSSYDQLISGDVYEKSLRSYIELREKAKKDNELIGKRERLSYLLRHEQQMFLRELKCMDSPECQLLYDDIRQKGFFEKLYEQPNGSAGDHQTVVLPHLLSEYEQQHEQGDACLNMKVKQRQRAELRDFLLNQQREKRSKAEEERRKEMEEEQEALRKLKILDENDRRYREQEIERRRHTARANNDIASDARRIQATLEAAVEEEAKQIQAKEVARRALEEAKRQQLRKATQHRIQEQVHERAQQRRDESEKRRLDERLERLNAEESLTAEREAAVERRMKMVESTRRAYSSQIEEKRERARLAVEAGRREMEQDRAAELAYEALMKEEAAKLRTREKSSFRLFNL